MDQNILKVSNLTKVFPTKKGDFKAVNDISFTVGQGEIVGLLGPNGAGKTTTIQMLLGLMTPTSGEISYFGLPFDKNREKILQQINFSSAYAKMPWRTTVWENLQVFCRLYQIKNRDEQIKKLASAFNAFNLLNKKMQDLSAGQTTRCLLIKAFINDPKVVLLDEPTASLDPDVADNIRSFILEKRKQQNLSVLITSHNMGEVEEMCDRVIFINHGKIIAQDTPLGLARRNKNSIIKLMIADGLKRIIDIVHENKYTYTEKNRFVEINLPEVEIAKFLNIIGQRGISFNEIEIERPSLEDFFLETTKRKS